MRMSKSLFFKNLHLGSTALVVISAGLIYGGNPSEILPQVFGFEVRDLELKNMLRAIMGLYLAVGSYWIIGVCKPQHWRAATQLNILFMGGIAFGRVVSTILDGFSLQFGIGLLLELLAMIWGFYNLKRYS